MKKTLALALLVMLMFGCSSQTCVLVQQTRGIGIRASYNSQSQLPEFWLGYIGNSLVLAPTNRQADTTDVGEPGGAGQCEGAKDTTNIITDFQLSNFFSFWRDHGVYERVAIGDKAVENAKWMMLRDAGGELSSSTIEAINKLQTVDQKLADLATRIPGGLPPGAQPIKTSVPNSASLLQIPTVPSVPVVPTVPPTTAPSSILDLMKINPPEQPK